MHGATIKTLRQGYEKQSCVMQLGTGFSEEQFSCLKMILGSKYVGAILNLLI